MSTYCEDVWVVEYENGALEAANNYADACELTKSPLAEQCCMYVDVQKLLDAEARIKELESKKLSERVTDEQINVIFNRLSALDNCVAPIEDVRTAVREWLKEMER